MVTCFHCKENLEDERGYMEDRYIKISLVYETKYPGEGMIIFHIDCFSKMAGKRFTDTLHKELREGQNKFHDMDALTSKRKVDEANEILREIEKLREKEKLKNMREVFGQMQAKQSKLSNSEEFFTRELLGTFKK